MFIAAVWFMFCTFYLSVKVKYDKLNHFSQICHFHMCCSPYFTVSKPSRFVALYKANSTQTKNCCFCWTKHTSVTTTNSVTHHYRWHQMLLRTCTGVVCWRSQCTATDSACFHNNYSTTVTRCCGREEEETGRIASARHHTASWSTPWRPCFYSSSYHTPYPSCHYGGPPLYQSSGPDLQSVWLLSSLQQHTQEIQTIRWK